MLLGEILAVSRVQLPLLQLSQPIAPVTIAPVISTPQIFVAIVAGVVMAIAFQLLLTNLGIAIGVTALGLKLVKKTETEDVDAETDVEANAKPEKSSAIGTIGFAAGLGILLTLNVVLFAACFLAGKLSLVDRPVVGGIVGVVIWATYFLLLLWLSSSAVSSIVGLILGGATAGLRGLVGAVSAVVGGKKDEPYMTETATINAIRQEVRSALKSDDMQDTLKTFVGSLPAPQLDLQHVGGGLESILKSPEVLALAGSGLLSKVNRQTFLDLLRDRHDLSKKDAEQVVTHLETVWQQAMPRSNPTGELLKLLKSANPEELQSSIAPFLQQFLQPKSETPEADSTGGLLETIQQNVDFGTIRRALISRVDLSDLDVEQIWEQLKSLRSDDATTEAEPSQSEPSTSEPTPAKSESFNSIAADLETFLLDAYPWQLKSNLIPATLREILYDPEADPSQVRLQVNQIQPDSIAAILAQRDLSEEQIDRLLSQLQTVQQEVLATTEAAEANAQLNDWRSQLEVVWRADKDGVRSLPDGQQAEALSHTLKQVDRAALIELLPGRPNAPAVDEWIDRLEAELATRQETTQAIVSDLWQKLKPYFRYTKVQQLTPANVQRKLEAALDEIEAEFDDLPAPNFDWDKLESVLKRRKSMSSEQLEEIVTQAKQIWANFTSEERRQARSRQMQLARFTQAMRDYLLKSGDRPELRHYLQQAGVEVATLKQLRSIDWQAVKDQLQPQLDSAQLQQQMQLGRNQIRQIVKPPRRWAVRTQPKWNFSDQLQAYLQQSDAAELDSLSANLSRLIADAQDRGFDTTEILQTPFDRAALTEVLSSRVDLDAAAVETLIDRLDVVRSQLWEDTQQQQSHLQSAFEELQGKLKQYLSSIALPDLNYDSIKQDLYKLLSLPQAGLEKIGDSIDSLTESGTIETLRDRLGQFNRDAIESLLQARDDFSQSVTSRVVEQFEGVRSQVTQQVEQVQLEAQRRLEALQQQAQRRAEETRRAAMIAAWWLFCTAITSLTTAAVAGTLGVTGIHIGHWSI